MSKSLIEDLKKSGNKVLEASANNATQWSMLKHNKKDLETFLKYNIAELRFRLRDGSDFKTIVCTSNTRLIKTFQAFKEFDKKKALASTPFDGIRTNDSTSILTFNLVDNKFNTVSLKAWSLGNSISITEENVAILDVLLSDLLGRKTDKKKSDDSMYFK